MFVRLNKIAVNADAAGLRSLNPALVAVVLRTNMDVCDGGVRQYSRAGGYELIAWYDVARLVSNPVVVAVPANDRRLQEAKPRREGVAVIPSACVPMKKDRPHFCVRLHAVEWPVCRHQLELQVTDADSLTRAINEDAALVPYDASWRALFSAERERLVGLFPSHFLKAYSQAKKKFVLAVAGDA